MRLPQVWALVSALAHLAACGDSLSSALFTALALRVPSAPARFLSRPSRSDVECSAQCSDTPDCFGFYWVPTACNLFNASGLAKTSQWVSSEQCDIYTKPLDQPISLAIAGCNQSSTHATFVCGKAFDGNFGQDLASGSCTHTAGSGVGDWWEAQLSSPSLVSYVTIYNRQECCPERLSQFSLQVDGVECNRVNLTVPFSVSNFTCMGYGSRVRVTNLANAPVTICEFQARGISV